MNATLTICVVDLPLSALAVLKTWLHDCPVRWKSLNATELPTFMASEFRIPDVLVWYLTAENFALLTTVLLQQLTLTRIADQAWVLTEQELPAAAGPFFSTVGIAQVWRSSLELGPRLQLAIQQITSSTVH